MSAQTIQFDADVAAIEAEVPVVFKFNGVNYVGSRTPIMDKQAMEDAGFAQLFDFQLIVRLSLFVAPISPMRVHDTISIQDAVRGLWVDYNVATVQPSQDGVTMAYGVTQKT